MKGVIHGQGKERPQGVRRHSVLFIQTFHDLFGVARGVAQNGLDFLVFRVIRRPLHKVIDSLVEPVEMARRRAVRPRCGTLKP
jgi:hypothetical protein